MHALKKFDLNFQGYWTETEAESLPTEAGILCAFARDLERKPHPDASPPRPTRILRISDCLSARDAVLEKVASGELSHLIIPGEQVAYSFAPLLFGREQAAAAMIYRFKPIGNHEHKFSFRFEPVQIILRGKIGKLQPGFVSPDPEDKDVSRLLERLGLSLTA